MATIVERFRVWRNSKRNPADEGLPVDGTMDLTENEERLKKQRIGLIAASSIVVLGTGYWLLGTEEEEAGLVDPNAGAEIRISQDDLASRNLSEQEWMALSENRLSAQDRQLQGLQGQGDQLEALQAEVQALRSQNSGMAADGSRVVDAYETENSQLRQQLAAAQASAASAASGPRALYGAGGPPAYQTAGGAVAGGRSSELKVISFTSAAASSGSGGTPPPRGSGTAVQNESRDYLPANSFAKARVIVGVDAASSVSSQADPLPVVLRITGPARSVADNGRLLTTKIQGCLVNGAARGDLSSEKVYVRLAKMTCPVGGGRFAETEVKGFIAFGGKTGVRGRVVSREGSLATQAFFAGLVGGIGRGFSANSQGFLNGATTIVGGGRDKLSPGEIAQAGIGEGVSTAGDMVSQYLIEKAEQYQPVIEMPTGIDVEIVFLEGVQVRN